MRLCRDAVSEMVGRWNETLIGELSSNSSQTSTHSLQSSPPYFLQRIAVSIPSTPTSQHFNSQPHLSTPTPSHHLPSLIPSRVSAFNIPETSNLNRPPTIDEARTWASTSTLTAQNATPTPTLSLLQPRVQALSSTQALLVGRKSKPHTVIEWLTLLHHFILLHLHPHSTWKTKK